ncbi:glycosyltransferase [Rothia sp. SD9660Na]|uniref:glycosyltransferase n=1 Tax=Rothia sp. SD9660Na TaxID=3047030 RepID=UPI0024BB8FA3|nr:glycosyltransferase [Rothia sp. SD9660Na]WHS51156.1 glycosyltransferase [Rothia sp. SD9660Na]
MVYAPTPQVRPQERIVAVVVTYNRRELLEQTLAGIEAGELTPDTVIIVNNASTDGTEEYLGGYRSSLATDIVHLPQNVGGAGGFTVGIDRALNRHAADLVWVMDDDTEPTENTLSEAYRAWADYSPVRAERPAVVASKVVWTNGQDHPMNTMRTMFAAGPDRTARAAAVGARPIRSASFVSILMDAAAMRATDLPLADFFIWNDDFEYTTRLIHHSNGIATERSVARHHTKTFGTTDAKPGPRFYNDVRNKLWVFCARRTLTPLEKLLYGGSTARLWVSTLLRTDEKKTYTGYFLKGLQDAAAGYRSNSEVLDGVYQLETPQLAQRIKANYGSDPKFSVLMSVYAGDQPEHLRLALASNTEGQTLRPNQLVLVQDGPVSAELSQIIADFEEQSSLPVTVVRLAENYGLAAALHEGLTYCDYDIVARADSDDVSAPDRFAQQVPLLAAGQYDVLGSAMYEFTDDPARPESERKAVTGARAIREMLPKRNPMLHPTVVFRKSAVEAVGSYVEVPGAEDYWLWARMSRAGFVLGNLSQPLVSYRVATAYTRRGGIQALRKDLHIQCRLYTGGVLGPVRFAQNLAIRGVYRLAPEELRTRAFRAMTGRNPQGKKEKVSNV